MRTYFAIVHKDEDSAVGVAFPDLPGCFSAGDTYDKVIANAHIALRLYAEAERSAGRQLPKPRTVREAAEGAPFVGIRLENDGLAPIGDAAKAGAVGSKHKPPRRSRKAG